MAKDFLDCYLEYTRDTEATATFHRWSAIVGIGAWLERNVWIQHGANQHFPNHYAMLLGESGSRKSAAIKGFVRILREAGYSTIAAEKTTKEKFSLDLAEQHQSEDDEDELLWGEVDKSAITPILIANDEANDFFGINNIEFLSMLGSWWDYNGVYELRYKMSKSEKIPNPTPSILVGNTPTNFSLAFPPTIIGQGFFSRILLIHGERTRPKITWPTPPDPGHTAEIVRMLVDMKSKMMGELVPTEGARKLMDKIYHLPDFISDERFASYFNRRLTHLMKLCLIVAAAKQERHINEDTVIQANSYLTYIQNLMPKALGEYGRSADAPIVQKLMSIINNSHEPLPTKELAKQLVNDIPDMGMLRRMLEKLVAADKVQVTQAGWIPLRQDMLAQLNESSAKFIDMDGYLTAEELGVKT